MAISSHALLIYVNNFLGKLFHPYVVLVQFKLPTSDFKYYTYPHKVTSSNKFVCVNTCLKKKKKKRAHKT
jgi:hypothetical protein